MVASLRFLAVLAVLAVATALNTFGGSDPDSGPPDISRLSTDPRVVNEGDWVDFIAQASDPDGRRFEYRWDFGDGDVAEDAGSVDIATMTHRYRDNGSYQGSLRVDAEDGESVEKRFTVVVKNVAPEIRDLSRSGAGIVNSPITFRAGVVDPGPDDEISYSWDFGDDTTADGPTPTHAFEKDGVYRVTLVVDDGDGGNASGTIVVVVGEGFEFSVAGEVSGEQRGRVAVNGVRVSTQQVGNFRPGFCYIGLSFFPESGNYDLPSFGISAALRSGLEAGDYAFGIPPYPATQGYEARQPGLFFADLATEPEAAESAATFASRSGVLSLDYVDATRVEGSFQLFLDEIDSLLYYPRARQASVTGYFAAPLKRDGPGAANNYDCPSDETFAIETHFPDRNDENIDPQDPELEVVFTAPYDPATLNEETLRIEYRLAGNGYAPLDGFIERVDDRTVRFAPAYDLLDGVLYCVRIKAGEEGVRGLDGEVLKVPPAPMGLREIAEPGLANRTFRACMAGGRPFEEAYEWGFATLVVPASIRVALFQAAQVAAGIELVPRKPTLARVFAEWEEKKEIHRDAQVRRFPADVEVMVNGGSAYTPKRRILVLRPDQYDAGDRRLARNSINFFGWRPGWGASAAVVGRVKPLEQNRAPAREFESATYDVPVWRHSPSFNFDYYFLRIGRWINGVPAAERASGHLLAKRTELVTTQNFPVVGTRSRVGRDFEIKLDEQMLAEFRQTEGVLWDIAGIMLRIPDASWGKMQDDSRKAALQALVRIFADQVGPYTDASTLVALVPSSWSGGGTTYYMPGESDQGHDVFPFRTVHMAVQPYAYVTNALTHEFGHSFGLRHEPEVDDAQRAIVCANTQGIQAGIEGFRMARGGRRGWNKSSTDGNAELSGQLYPLMFPCAKRTTESFIRSDRYRLLQDAIGAAIDAGTYRGRVAFTPVPTTTNSLLAVVLPLFVGDVHAAGLPTEPGSATTRPTGSAGPDALLVSGFIRADGARAILAPIRRWERPDTGPINAASSAFVAVAEASDGRVLGEARLAVDGNSADGAEWQYFRAVLSAGADADRVVVRKDGVVIGERRRSPRPPRVLVDTPRASETWTQPTLLSWTGKDGDGDALAYTILYSPDGAFPWRVLAALTAETGLEIDPAGLEPGPEPVLRILASDGFNESEARLPLTLRTGLRVLATLPAGNTPAAPTTEIVVFVESELPREIPAERVRLMDAAGRAVPADVRLGPARRSLLLDPISPLEPGARYQAVLGAGIEDRYGNALTEDYSWSFSIASDTGVEAQRSVPGEPAAPNTATTVAATPVATQGLAWDHPAYLSEDAGRELGPDGVRFLWGRVSGDFEDEFAGNERDGTAMALVRCQADQGLSLRLFDATSIVGAGRIVSVKIPPITTGTGLLKTSLEYTRMGNFPDIYRGIAQVDVRQASPAESPGGPRLVAELQAEGLRNEFGKSADLLLRLDLNSSCAR